MRRRKAVKAIALTTVTPQLLFSQRKNSLSERAVPARALFESTWDRWPDMAWAGPEFWGNRLQDWQIKEGAVVCGVSDVNRSLHCLTRQLSGKAGPFDMKVAVLWVNDVARYPENYVGFMLGAKGKFDDYRSASVFGQGLRAGVTGDGKLFIMDKKSEMMTWSREFVLELRVSHDKTDDTHTISLKAVNVMKEVLGELVVSKIPSNDLAGNVALISHFANAADTNLPSVAFRDWAMQGPKLQGDEGQTFGPICFAQYTLHKKILKLTAQLAPVESIPGRTVSLQIMAGDEWKTVSQSDVDPRGRTAHFRVEGWTYSHKVPYRVRLELPLKGGRREFYYEGEIAHEPMDARQVKMAVFSCNCDYGFPDADIPWSVGKHNPDLAVFLGDQFYESTGGFGIQTSPEDKASLDYLRKWYMFGWSYRDIFRSIPSVCIPDDHDVYHGNVWGEGGKIAPTDEGWGYPAQDRGGYKMPAEWVNMVQSTQTSHLPDPYDPARIQQGIAVYYTSWNYAGISMAILEDRKFKSAPKNVLPPEAKVTNGFIQNPDFDIRRYRDVNAELLGERQIKFLEDWAASWDDGSEMKVVLSQTNFCTVATLPAGSIIDSMVPGLPIPEPGIYVDGDSPTADMDSNGWPQEGRDLALSAIRKCFALHVAGDQHLASVVHYGIADFDDAGFAFAGPALNNLWPRRWWPPPGAHEPLPGKPPYTGRFRDGFGNRMTVLAVANPRKTNKLPGIIHDRATGYGIITFDKEERTMKIECWPRYSDPEKGPGGQYEGWPITIRQEDNYGRKAIGYLPTIVIQGGKDPVVQLINETDGQIEYTLRIKGNTFKAKVFQDTKYTVKVSEPDRGAMTTMNGVALAKGGDERIRIQL